VCVWCGSVSYPRAAVFYLLLMWCGNDSVKQRKTLHFEAVNITYTCDNTLSLVMTASFHILSISLFTVFIYIWGTW
jgi:hypothetical protein